MRRCADELRRSFSRRRTVREFSSRPLPPGVIEDCVAAAGSAPSGANMQPWHFVVIRDPGLKREIRRAAEAEERAFYDRRAPAEWLEALRPLETDASKPFLEQASCLIAVFEQRHGLSPEGLPVKHYYTAKSAGIATGLLISALHQCGLGILTNTPARMSFLRGLLNRPDRERPYILLAVGYPEPAARPPQIRRKNLDQIATFLPDPAEADRGGDSSRNSATDE